jgi:hypothetical protein
MRAAEARSRYQRLQVLRADLSHATAARRIYAVETLLGLLWVAEGQERLAVACVLCGYPPQPEKAATPLCVARLCARLNRTASGDAFDLPPPPPAAERIAWAGQAAAALLTESLDSLKAALRTPQADMPILRREIAVCQDALLLAKHLRAPEVAEPCVRLLRFLPTEWQGTGCLPTASGGRDTPQTQAWKPIPDLPLARQTTLLREAAAQVLGALSPDALPVFWDALRSPQPDARQYLLPALDYLNDPRAIPYLIQLLERRAQWPDGEIVGWFVVRACERIGDRRALPALRRLAASGSRPLQEILPWLRPAIRAETSPELIREALRVVQILESGRPARERNVLLRPSGPQDENLLRPAADPPDADYDTRQLLRPEEG